MFKSLLLVSTILLTMLSAHSKTCYSYETGEYGVCKDLSGVQLSGKDLRTSDWIGANLTGADLSNTILDYSFMSKANLSYADLSGASAYAGKFYKANLYKTNLKGADMRGSSFIGADLSEAIVNDKTLFNGSSIDSNTKLPNSWGKTALSTAVEKGMITIREVKPRKKNKLKK